MIALPLRLSVLVAWLSATPAPPDALPPEVRTLQDALRHTDQLSAHFEQTRHWSALKDTLRSDGHFDYTRGGRMVWRTEHPAVSVMTLEGQSAVMAYPALKTEQTIDFSTDPGMGKVFDTIRAVLQADLEVLKPLFALAVVRSAPLAVTLTPRTPELQRLLKGIRLEFDAQSLLTHVALTEPGGDFTDLRFSDHHVKRSGR